MSTVSISSPFPIFTDIDGQPLENGYIFIGVANLGPIGNPVNVYWDAALTIPAAQPIRTLGGYPVNNGTPARLYVNSQYSIQVQNRNGSVIYSAPVDTEFMSSANISYLPAGTGAVATTVQAKLRETVSVKDFGAVGDGVADDTAAMQLAHNTGKLVFYPRGEYLCSGGITFSNGGFLGDGAGQAFISSISTSTNDIFIYTGTSQLECSGVQFMQKSGFVKTTGSCIKIQPTSSLINSYTNISACNFVGFPVGLNFVAADHFRVTNCNFIGNLNSGAQVANVINGDAGDSCFLSCEFNSALTTGVGIEHINSGGLRIVGCKFNGMAHSYLLTNVPNNPTGGVFFTGNSFENCSDTALLFARDSGTTSWLGITITGNQFGGNPRSIGIGGVNFGKTVSITGNIFTLTVNGYGIGMDNVADFEIVGNVFVGGGRAGNTGITLDTCTNGKIGSNVYSGLSVAPISLFSSPTVSIAKDMQSGVATTSAVGWVAWVGAIYASPVTTVAYPTSFLTAPALQDIVVVPADSNGPIFAITVTTIPAGFNFQVFSTVNGIAANVRWQAQGIL